jgi:hypothetical protein
VQPRHPEGQQAGQQGVPEGVPGDQPGQRQGWGVKFLTGDRSMQREESAGGGRGGGVPASPSPTVASRRRRRPASPGPAAKRFDMGRFPGNARRKEEPTRVLATRTEIGGCQRPGS